MANEKRPEPVERRTGSALSQDAAEYRCDPATLMLATGTAIYGVGKGVHHGAETGCSRR